METVNVILKIGAIFTSFLVPSLEAAFRIKRLLELDPDVSVSIQKINAAAIAASNEFDALYADWKQRHGLS